MSKIPTPAAKKKVICTRRSGMFNKNVQKENLKPSASKAGTSGTTRTGTLGRNLTNIQTRQQVQNRQATLANKPSTSNMLPAVRPGISAQATANSSQNPLNRKRPANTANEKHVEPKIKKAVVKIPPYDFKARFYDLKEKHDRLKATQDEKSQEIEDIKKQKIDLQIKYDEELMKRKRLEQELRHLRSNYELLKEECNDLQYTKQALENAESKLHHTTARLLESEEYRRKLHNDVQDLKGNIRVFCRCRPFNSRENDKMMISVSYLDEQTMVLYKQDNKHEFTFDKVYAPRSPQECVFEDLAQLVQSSLDGYNVCVFAYGQTGSGKTYTMIGENDSQQKGMIPRAVELIFSKIEETKDYNEYDVKLSILEIYNENIRDLLSDKKLTHDIKYNDGRGVTVTNLVYHDITKPREFYSLLQLANKNRATATTNLNEHSSRSHEVIEIQLKSVNKISNLQLSSKIYLVDLAGSENAKNSQRMEETKAINKSLANLGNVMLALQNKDKFVPYRNSKLTYLLQSALGGNSKTLMFVNVSPLEEHLNETLNSLRFAGKVRKVTTKSKRVAITTD